MKMQEGTVGQDENLGSVGEVYLSQISSSHGKSLESLIGETETRVSPGQSVQLNR